MFTFKDLPGWNKGFAPAFAAIFHVLLELDPAGAFLPLVAFLHQPGVQLDEHRQDGPCGGGGEDDSAAVRGSPGAAEADFLVSPGDVPSILLTQVCKFRGLKVSLSREKLIVVRF